MANTKLKGYPVGEQLYIFCAGSRPEPARTRDLIITAHGGFSRSSSFLNVPNWVRGLYFYSPHGAILSDPGIKTIASEIHAFQIKRPGDVVTNYGLTKYQGKHSTSGETYESIMKDVGKRALGVADLQANPGARATFSALQNRLTTVAAALNTSKKQRQELRNELKNPPPASDPGTEDFTAIREEVLQRIEEEVEQMQQQFRAASTAVDSASKVGMHRFLDAAEEQAKRSAVQMAEDPSDPDVLMLYDVLTIRNRRFRSEMTLKGVFDQLYAAGLMYPRLHCSFCRSPVDQPDSHDMSWRPAWNTEIRR